jgi:hypothetical protein
MTRLAFILALLFTATWQEAETVDVKDRGPVDLKPFDCQDVTRSSLIARVCYDDANQYVLVQRNGGIYDHYCELPKAVRDVLLNAASIGQHFNANIKAAGRYDCRAHKVPSYQ